MASTKLNLDGLLHPLRGLAVRTRWALVLSLLLFTATMLALALLDYFRVKALTEQLAADQARVLIAHVEQSTQRAALAEEVVRQAVDDQ